MNMPSIVAATPLPGHRLRLCFADGFSGEVDVTRIVAFEGVLEPLADQGFFSRVRVDEESGTVVWPNEADLDPLVLYAAAKGVSVDDLLAAEDAIAG